MNSSKPVNHPSTLADVHLAITDEVCALSLLSHSLNAFEDALDIGAVITDERAEFIGDLRYQLDQVLARVRALGHGVDELDLSHVLIPRRGDGKPSLTVVDCDRGGAA
ncbi:MAG: hypothetical protein ACREUG_10055 [Steroidobacteraceae bacterium]